MNWAAWPDPGAAGQARSTASIWRACRAIAKPHSVGSACALPCVVFEGNWIYRSGAFVHRRALRELWRKAAQPVCWRVQGLHEGQHGYLQHLLQAQGRELERSRAKHALGLDPGVDTGSREEHASKQKSGAPVLIQSEPILL